MNRHLIKSAFIVALLFTSSAVCFGATEKTAYNATDIYNLTATNTPYKLASEKEWLLHDESLQHYKTKIAHNDSSLKHDKKYLELRSRSLQVRNSFYQSSMKIVSGRNQIDQHARKLARKVAKMNDRTEKTIDSTFASIAKYRKSFENSWNHDQIVQDFDGELIYNANGSFHAGSIGNTSDCRELALTFSKAKNFLYAYYHHKLALYKKGKFHPSRDGLFRATLERDNNAVDDAIYYLKPVFHEGANGRHIKVNDVKVWRFCTKIYFKVDHDSINLTKYLTHVHQTMFGNIYQDQDVKAFLSSK